MFSIKTSAKQSRARNPKGAAPNIQRNEFSAPALVQEAISSRSDASTMIFRQISQGGRESHNSD
jgi:hypothetical protein